jgi:hypothetical protein
MRRFLSLKGRWVDFKDRIFAGWTKRLQRCSLMRESGFTAGLPGSFKAYTGPDTVAVIIIKR